MKRHPIQNSDLAVSSIGLGTWAMAGRLYSWGKADDRESIEAIHTALDAGMNLIDTAPIYGLGHAEEIVGKAIFGRRSEVLLATKCGVLSTNGEDQTRRCLSYDSILRECEASLRRLRTDIIDLYQCHWPDPDTPIRETMRALGQLLDLGSIRAIGLSNFSCEQIRAAMEFGPVHAVQLPFSILNTRAGLDLMPFCEEHRIAVLAYSPLGKGILAGRYTAEATFEGVRAKDPDFIGNRYQRNLRVAGSVREIAASIQKTPAQLALNWAANYPGVTCAIMGARRPSQVTESAAAAGWDIPVDVRASLDQLAGGLGREH